jgi:hypothetical protein
MKDYKTSFNSFIGGWFINENICDELINFYHKNNHLKTKATVYTDNKLDHDDSVKEGFDLKIHNKFIYYPFNLYREELQKCLDLYVRRYNFINNINKFNINNSYNIQHYPIGGGFKVWHQEHTVFAPNRILVFMTYLNDVKDGGTEFFYQKIKTEAKKGLTLIWPAGLTHFHRGIISNTQEKMIVTGWYEFTKEKNE